MAKDKEISPMEQALDTIKAQEEVIKRLTAMPYMYGTVLEILKESLLVAVDGRTYEVELPREKWVSEIVVGGKVRLNTENMAVVGVGTMLKSGKSAVVVRVHEKEKVMEVELNGEPVVVLGSAEQAKPGDTVVIDSTGQVVVGNLGHSSVKFGLSEIPDVRWDDIGGQEEAKQMMVEAIEMPYKFKELYKKFGKKPLKGVLLYGPPGCGKTMLGKAAANALAKLHGSEVGGFLYVKGPEMLSMWVGNTEAAIREIFAKARRHLEENGFPAVIFIDEADSMMRKRGAGISSDVEHTIVPAFLAELDGMQETGAITMLATNRPDIMDPAVIRDGRIDRKVFVGRPNEEDTRQIFDMYLRGIPKDGKLSDFVKEATEEVFSEKYTLVTLMCSGRKDIPFTLGRVVSGAMIHGIVDRATSVAIRRSVTMVDQEYLTIADLRQAVKEAFVESLDVDFSDDLKQFMEPFKEDVMEIEKGGLRGAA